MAPARVAHVRRLGAGWVEQGLTPALQIAVARRGVIVLHEAWGRLGPEPDAPPLGLDAIFGIASITKPITATAVLCLVEDGLLGLNRPVQEYVPEFVGEGKDRVLVQHLLTHTSGLSDELVKEHLRTRQRAGDVTGSDEPEHPAFRLMPFLQYFADAAAAPLARRPGEEMAYSNFGISLLGEIVERVSGRSLAAFAHARIFAPLGMADTRYGVSADIVQRIVQRAPDIKGAHLLGRLDLPGRLLPIAGVCSTALDMAIFGQVLLNRGTYGHARILSPATVATMTRNQIPGIPARYGDEFFPEATWGLGFGVRGDKKALRDGSLLSPAAISHGGAGGTFWWVDPSYDLVGVYFSVTPQYYPSLMEKWNADLFMNAITAAIADAPHPWPGWEGMGDGS